MSLHSFLTRLIWLCMLPPVLLATYLAVSRVQSTQAARDLDAANLAKNFATAIDQNLVARIGALSMLAASPLADNARHRRDLYDEAQGFRQSFGSHVILANPEMQMLINTRVPFGTALPMLPRPRGHAAAAIALETGKPAVGDTFIGPFAKEPLVALAIPGRRDDKTVFLLLTTFEARRFQDRLDQVALPADWALSLLDGKDDVIARRAPADWRPGAAVDAAGRFVVKSSIAPWSVVLEIPRDVYRAPLLTAGAGLAITIIGATLAGALGGQLASRRLGQAVESLAQEPPKWTSPPDIAEISAVRRLLDESARSLHELNASLEQHVAERTAQLETANKDLEGFSYSVSHDLRTPLRAIDGFSKFLLQDYADKLDDEGKRLLHVVRDNTTRMARLIDDILAFSRVGRLGIVMSDVDMNEIVQSVIHELEPTYAGRRVTIDSAPLPKVQGDAAMMRQVLTNLLTNAIKFTRTREAARIEVGTRAEGVENVFYVKDNGVGFDPQYTQKLFGVFQRLHGADEFEGTGIGLAIVKRVITKHGGRVWGEGKVGEGATFYFALPGTGLAVIAGGTK